jgi:hypothetical protein
VYIEKCQDEERDGGSYEKSLQGSSLTKREAEAQYETVKFVDAPKVIKRGVR